MSTETTAVDRPLDDVESALAGYFATLGHDAVLAVETVRFLRDGGWMVTRRSAREAELIRELRTRSGVPVSDEEARAQMQRALNRQCAEGAVLDAARAYVEAVRRNDLDPWAALVPFAGALEVAVERLESVEKEVNGG